MSFVIKSRNYCYKYEQIGTECMNMVLRSVVLSTIFTIMHTFFAEKATFFVKVCYYIGVFQGLAVLKQK
jgi:hypothetical protein